MSENDNQQFSWLGQLQELYNTSTKSVEDLTKSVLNTVLDTLNPEAPTTQESQKTFNSPDQTNNRTIRNANIFIPKEPNIFRIRKEAIYDKVYEDFISNYKRFNDEESAFDDQKLRGEFNSLLINEFNKNNPTNNLEKLTETENSIASLAFSTTLTRLLEIESFSENHRASKGEFQLLLTDQQELHAIIAKKYFDKHPDAFSVFDEQGSLKNKDKNSNPEAPNADCPDAFSVFDNQKSLDETHYNAENPILPLPSSTFTEHKKNQEAHIRAELRRSSEEKFPLADPSASSVNYLFANTILKSFAYTILKWTASCLPSSIIGSYKIPDSQSNQDSVQQKTATMPTGNQTPGTAPELEGYKTRIGPMQKAVAFYENTPPQLRSLIGLNSPSNSSRSN